MRAASVTFGVAFGGALVLAVVVAAEAQQPPRPGAVETSDPFKTTLQQSPQPTLNIPTIDWNAPLRPTRLGPLTIVPPDGGGQFVKVVVPVGDFVTHGARSFSSAHRRRVERKARERVSRELSVFLASQPSSNKP